MYLGMIIHLTGRDYNVAHNGFVSYPFPKNQIFFIHWNNFMDDLMFYMKIDGKWWLMEWKSMNIADTINGSEVNIKIQIFPEESTNNETQFDFNLNNLWPNKQQQQQPPKIPLKCI